MRRRTRLPALPQLLWAIGYVAVGVTVAAAMAWPIYQSPRVILIAAVGGLVGMGLAVLAAWRAWPWWWTAAALVLSYAVLVVPLAIPAALSSPLRVLVGVRDGFTGIILGWKQLVTIELPLGQYQAVLVPLLVVILVGSFAALSLALRPTSSAVAAVPVVLGMSAFGIAFGASQLGAPLRVLWFDVPGGALVLLGVGIVVASLLWLVGRARLSRSAALARARGTAVGVRQGREATWPVVRRNALGAGILVVAIGAGLAIAPLTAGASSRTTLRDAAEPFLNVSSVQSPLTTYRGWFAGDTLDSVLFTVSGASEGLDRVRLATLTEFDGTRFELATASANFTRIANSEPTATDESITVTIGEGYEGPWLPLPGVATSAPAFSGARGERLTDGLFLAPGGTTAVVVDREAAETGVIRSSLQAGDTFTVAGTPVPSSGVLEGVPGGEPLLDPEQYDRLVDWVDRQDLARTGDGLIEAIRRLTDRGFLSHARSEDAASEGWIAALSARADYTFEPSLAGHSTARVEQLFSSLIDQELKAGENPEPSALVAGVGDDEQFAVASALVARYFGFDSRVVFGVVLATDAAVPSVLPCTPAGECTGANVTVWTEVQAPNGQWARLDATPQFAEPLSRVVVGEVLPEHPTVPDEVSSEILAPPTSIRADSDEPATNTPSVVDARTILEVLRWVGLGVLTLLLLVLPAVVLAVAKVVQRRRRRAEAVPEAAIVGAWDELVDRYVDAGILSSTTGTRRQIALASRRPAALSVADAADLAVFDAAASTSATADAVWDVVATERSGIREGMPLRKRLAASLSTAAFVAHVKNARARRRASGQ